MTDAVTPGPAERGALEVAPRRWMRWWWAPAVAVVVALLVWWMTHPSELATTDREVEAATKVGRTIHVGVTTQDPDAESRELALRGVEVRTSAEGDGVRAEALVCHGGSISTTTDPAPFCDSVEKADGATLDLAADQLIVAVTAESAQQVTVEPVRVSFREGLQWGTHPTGPGIVVDVRG